MLSRLCVLVLVLCLDVLPAHSQLIPGAGMGLLDIRSFTRVSAKTPEGQVGPTQDEARARMAEDPERQKNANVDGTLFDGTKPCGPNALRAVFEYHQRGRADAKVPALQEILDHAKNQGYCWGGDKCGIRPGNLASIAEHFGYEAETYNCRWTGTKALRKWVSEGLPVIVVVGGCDKNGYCKKTPGYNFSDLHYAIVQGFISDRDGAAWVIVKHSWSKDDFFWKLDDFESAWAWNSAVVVRRK